MNFTQPIRILVFGTAGVGKTSVCNTLSNEKRETGNRARGVTFESQLYNEFSYAENQYLITDTIGLNEADTGAVKSKESLKALIKLLKNSKDGYNVLIHVMKIGRITNEISYNYKLFIDTIAQNKIPCILIVTGCENVQPMEKWAKENKHYFEEEGLLYKEIVAGCFGESENPLFESEFKKLRALSMEKTFSKIEECATPYSIRIYKSQPEFTKAISRIWNIFCDFSGYTNLKIKINEKIQIILAKMGLTKSEIEEIVKTF